MTISSTLRCLAAVAFLAVPALPSLAQEAPLRIAVVDLDTVVAESPAGKALQKKLEAFQQQAKAELDALNSAAASIRQRATEGANSLSEEELANLQKQFEDKQIEMRRLQDDKQRQGQKMQNEGLAEIERLLGPVFEKVRAEGNYDLILNRVPGVVVMANPRIDITRQVIERLEAGS